MLSNGEHAGELESFALVGDVAFRVAGDSGAWSTALVRRSLFSYVAASLGHICATLMRSLSLDPI